MENLVVSFNAVAPMFLLMCLGQFMKKIRLVSVEAFAQFNKAVFYVFVPAMLFSSIYEGDLSNIGSPAPPVFCTVGSVLGFLLGCFFSKHFNSDPNRNGVITLAFFRTNTMIIGLPIAAVFYDEITPMLVSFVVAAVCNNVLTSIVMAKKDRSHGGVIISTLKNPLLVSTLIGLVMNLLHIPLPVFVRNAISTAGDLTGGIALITLGASLNFSNFRRDAKLINVICLLRLIIIPAVALGLAALLGFRGVEMLSVLIYFGSATATMLFPITRELGDDAEFAGELIMVSHLFGFLTLFLWVFLMKSTGLM